MKGGGIGREAYFSSAEIIHRASFLNLIEVGSSYADHIIYAEVGGIGLCIILNRDGVLTLRIVGDIRIEAYDTVCLHLLAINLGAAFIADGDDIRT